MDNNFELWIWLANMVKELKPIHHQSSLILFQGLETELEEVNENEVDHLNPVIIYSHEIL